MPFNLGAGLLALLLVGFAARAQAADRIACVASDEAQISALFDRWNNSLRTLDPDQVLANYATDGVLLPTVSNEPRTTPAKIRAYFVQFLKRAPQGRIDQRLIKIGCNVAQDVGTYTFRFKNGGTVHARYTFVYEQADGQWLIAHHHSSAMPKVAAAKR